ncbi:methyl transferase type 11 [Bifidobacterium margollesii]|uniref:Methyl transferase type 11 n=1 Tax=Bifidobacterium margollesii TaxID=2020964 RepID=A0A2N5JBI5_9BIFI|nr:hypothetical protein [Bifidobacterium margollesii]PLS31565.1 methyl transferase type 11 [Bifidobacterium margollesii]
MNAFRVTHGDKALERLRKRGASDRQIAGIQERYRVNRANGMGKSDARIAAERDAGFGSGAGRKMARKAAKTSKSDGEPFVLSSKSVAEYRKQGFSEERIRKINSDTSKTRALMRKRKAEGDKPVTGVSQSFKNAMSRYDREFDRRFNAQWSSYRAAGWKR